MSLLVDVSLFLESESFFSWLHLYFLSSVSVLISIIVWKKTLYVVLFIGTALMVKVAIGQTSDCVWNFFPSGSNVVRIQRGMGALFV